MGLAAVAVLALVIASRLTLPPVGSPDTSGATHQRAPDGATAPPPAPQPAPDGSASAATLVASAVPPALTSPVSAAPASDPAAPQSTADRAPDPAPRVEPDPAPDGPVDGASDGAPPVAAASAPTASADGSDHDPRRHWSSTDSRRDARDGRDDVVDRDCDGGRHGGERR